MRETEFQKLLIDALKKEGGFGWKNDNKFIAGICDLTLIRSGRVYFVECKMMKYKKIDIGHTIKIDATKLQRRFLKTVRQAGGKVGIVVLIQFEQIDYIFVTPYEGERYCIWGVDDFIRRKKGEKWPVGKILDILI